MEKESYQSHKVDSNVTGVKAEVKKLLCRDAIFCDLSNKDFLLEYWANVDNIENSTRFDSLVWDSVRLTDPETILRCRRKVVEENPDLAANREMMKKKLEYGKEVQKKI